MADDEQTPPRIHLYFREWREWRGWSQEELAAKMGVSNVTVHRYETDKRKSISRTYLEKFVHTVGCPNPWDPIAGPPGTLPPTYQLLRNLKPTLQEHVRRVIESARDVDP
jgi:transcriptional regulator with XRE-family HTH domain